jgi:DNA helicase HerA-like ATPase
VTLFPRDKIVGIFHGFSQGGLEFHADLVLPYRSEFQSTPMHGQFLLVQLENQNEGVLGRITSLAAEGRLAHGAGEDYGLRALAEDRDIPEDLRDQYLKYRVNLRVLGVIRQTADAVVFAPSHRRLPHVGSRVAFLSEDLLREVAAHKVDGAELGFLALGEFVYGAGAGHDALVPEPWMQVCAPLVMPKFPMSQLISRRTFVFARAGFGKSNLNKLLFSNLYRDTPTVEKRGGRRVPVGTVIFDPDGEYFWPDDKGRPGLCDVPHMTDKLVVFTNRKPPSAFYGSFIAGNIKLDIRRMRPAEVLSIALSPERQEQQNVRKLKGLNDQDWWQLVDEIHANRNAADVELLKRLLKLEEKQESELLAARANMSQVVSMVHDPGSQLMDMLLKALSEGKLCVVDVSQMRGTPALILSGLILQRIFDHNQDQFTKAEPKTIPTIAVVEEAQSVLGGKGSSGEAPYITWVKEGRKFDLGAVLITQQPGSISPEILSQGDNWFVFHLLSSGDLTTLKRANAHFSDDLLSSLLNEPIPGHAVFWSSSGGKPYPIPVRILSFESMYRPQAPDGKTSSPQTYATKLRGAFADALSQAVEGRGPVARGGAAGAGVPDSKEDEPQTDASEAYVKAAFQAVQSDQALMAKLKGDGMLWGALMGAIAGKLPELLTDRDDLAFRNVRPFLDAVLGVEKWSTEKRPNSKGQLRSWVVPKPPQKNA